ncbi:MAG: hypothetical protein KGZ86_01035 [Candidatus Latescibacteria bacterium]|nr:hypothetical protein [Candidatus Latescibacterota bacterium]
MAKKTAFLAYNITQRSKVLAECLQAKIITAKVSSVPVVRLLNYPLLIFLTFLNLVAEKFDTVFVQLPPIHAAFPAYLYCKMFRKQLIFDTHSGIFFTHNWYQKIYLNLCSSMIKHIALNIVHNEDLLKQVLLKDTNTVVLEDKIPFSPSQFKPGTQTAITVICGYGKDEPIQEIIKTARSLPDLQFNLTGNSKKLDKLSLPSNIRLTGYLSDTDYLQILKDSSLIMVLTNRLNTVLCGAYEAVGLTRPLIISDTPTLRKYFYKGVVHTENKTPSIIQAINNAQQNLTRLYSEIVQLRDEKTESWQKQFEPVRELLTRI